MMAGQPNSDLARFGMLTAPARNNYFYGKLLDVFHFQMEQTYLNRQRWLGNRLGVGTGVLCGLEVELDDVTRIRTGDGVAPGGRPAAWLRLS
jgi:hypothetical protein